MKSTLACVVWGVRNNVLKLLISLLVVFAGCSVWGTDSGKSFSPAEWRQRLESDWVLDAVARSAGDQSPQSTHADAAGGCDGIKNGKWGFHTGHEFLPWWQVDLGEVQPIDRVVIWNRCDSAERANQIQVLLSDDGVHWERVYKHNGKTFFGSTDNKPLEVKMKKRSGRFVRVRLPDHNYLHLDEVEVFGPTDRRKNLALHRPADQASISQWSNFEAPQAEPNWRLCTERSLSGSRSLLERLKAFGVDVSSEEQSLKDLLACTAGSTKIERSLYFEARQLERTLALLNPRLNFDRIVFSKRKLGTFSHMSDQYYGWWSRPGGGIYVMENFKSNAPRLACLTTGMPEGSFLRPELSFDGTKVIFAYCKFYPQVAADTNKTDKTRLPEDSFYHVFEMNIDGSGLRQLTHGRYNDFDARYLPNGEIVFLSTRRGQFVQATKHCAAKTLDHDALPDSFVRCGGGDWRPVSVYTLHVMDADGGNLHAISPFENFEWTPAVASDGRIFYSRWDYVDRDNMPYMSLWSTNPDGTNPQLVYGNFTSNPYAVLEARPIPGSRKIMFTASAHHSYTAGTIVVLDTAKGMEGTDPLRRLTPEVCFPEIECWPSTWYAGPYPLSEDEYLAAWSNEPVRRENLMPPENGAGIYLCDSFGNRDLIYRDDQISSMDPIPVRSREKPPVISSNVEWDGAQEGRFLLSNVYDGLAAKPGEIKALRVVAVPAKTQPQMNHPVLGVTRDDPGKCILGTVPVEADGSAYFRVPSGVNVFFQALNADGMAVQTMRTATYVQPNQTVSCGGCHESRNATPQNFQPLAAKRKPSKLAPGPDGSWPMRFDKLVQPVLDRCCVDCHHKGSENIIAAKYDLTGDKSYDNLVSFGSPSLKENILNSYRSGKSTAGYGPSQTSALLRYLGTNSVHQTVALSQDDRTRLFTWMDTYAQRQGSFSPDQEQELEQLKQSLASLLERR